MSADTAIDLLAESLFQAADADSATGGADRLRGIYPIIATVSADGFERIEDLDLATRFERIADEFSENHREVNP